MRFAITSIVLLTVGYAIGGGEFGILDCLHELVWHNSLGKSIHDAVLNVDDDRLTDLYAGLRIDCRYGVVALLFGFITAILLPGRFALLPCIVVLGIVVRMWVPLLIELADQEELALAAGVIPDFVWDAALIPTCSLGIGIARLFRLRHFPRWRIKTAATFTLLFAQFLAAIVQRWSSLLPITSCGIVLVLSVWLLRQSDTIFGISPNHPMRGGGEADRVSNGQSTVAAP